jgi:hypothetical protein
MLALVSGLWRWLASLGVYNRMARLNWDGTKKKDASIELRSAISYCGVWDLTL